MKRFAVLSVLAAGVAAGALGLSLSPQPDTPSSQRGLIADLLGPGRVCGADEGRGVSSPGLRLKFASALAREAEGDSERTPALVEGLGAFSYPVTTNSETAQAYFDQGLKYTYAFNHHEAVRAFQAAQAYDPSCAMCFWGEAYALGPNINAAMEEAVFDQAIAAVDRALDLRAGASEDERGLINALAVRYTREGPQNDAYAEAMIAIAGTHSKDDHILALASEAIMTAQAWSYWDADGTPIGRAAQALSFTETVLARNPDHIPSIHLYIHLTEASPKPERARPFADRLAGLAPAAGHLVHMPAHTYFKLGDYKASLARNIEAVAADERYLAANEGSAVYRFGYYPHNVHFVLTSAQAMGDRDTAVPAGEKLSALITDDVMRAVPWTQPIKTAPMMALAQFGEAEAILAIGQPDPDFPYVMGQWHYARAMALIDSGNLEGALGEADAISALMSTAAYTALNEAGLPATPVAQVSTALIRGKVAQARGDHESAIAHLKRASETQDTIPYMEPPFWHYPTAQSLGSAYYAAGRYEAAEAAFRKALTVMANNGWALFGLMKTYEAMGNDPARAETERLFRAAWAGETQPEMGRL